MIIIKHKDISIFLPLVNINMTQFVVILFLVAYTITDMAPDVLVMMKGAKTSAAKLFT